MQLLQLVDQFLADMRGSKVRTFLSVLAIAWGTVAVVMLVAVGNAFQTAAVESRKDMGENAVTIWPMHTTKAFDGLNAGRQLDVRCADVMAMAKALDEVGAASPLIMQHGITIGFGATRHHAWSVRGVSAEYGGIRNLAPDGNGRFFNRQDLANRRRVVFLGNAVRAKLFGEADPTGATVMINGRPFQVVGALKSKGDRPDNGAFSQYILIPYTTHVAIWGDRIPESFELKPAPGVDTREMIASVRRHMASRYRFDPSDEGVLGVNDMAESGRFVDWFFKSLTALFGLSGLLTLGAGGVGVANVLFLSVQERRREIGIRMAVGARPGQILGQFLLEAGVLVALGGGAGLAFSALVIGTLRRLPLPDWLAAPELSLAVGLGTVTVLAAVALAAGLFPARRASRLDPVEALEA